jgi:hypothetical protein
MIPALLCLAANAPRSDAVLPRSCRFEGSILNDKPKAINDGRPEMRACV